jgi:16S rRNA (cytidine1402-2'-O)-methyltransferase
MGILYLVATPIGNLEDMTLRGLRILREAGMIAAEDTRQTHRLLERYDIHQRMVSYHEHNKIGRIDEILAALSEGDVALVSDAGMPGLNDPGYELIQAALQAGFTVSPVPGPSAPIAALVASGLPTDAFLFLGYLPRKSGERKQSLEKVAQLPYSLVFLEAPHRILESLEDMVKVLGNRPAAAARELTKVHEEFVRGTLISVREHFQQIEPRGEFTLVIGGAELKSEIWDEDEVRQALRDGISKGDRPGELSEVVARMSLWKKKDVYKLMLALKESQ